MKSHAEKMSTVFAEPFDKPKPAPATVKEGWTMPSGTCPECGAELEPVAVHDGAGDSATIGAYLECPEQCGDPVCLDWPFVREFVMASDFRALGFEVIVA